MSPHTNFDAQLRAIVDAAKRANAGATQIRAQIARIDLFVRTVYNVYNVGPVAAQRSDKGPPARRLCTARSESGWGIAFFPTEAAGLVFALAQSVKGSGMLRDAALEDCIRAVEYIPDLLEALQQRFEAAAAQHTAAADTMRRVADHIHPPDPQPEPRAGHGA